MSRWDIDNRGVASDAEFYANLDRVTKDGELRRAWRDRPADNWFFLVLDASASISRNIAEALAPAGCEEVEDLCHSLDSMHRPWAVILVPDAWLDRYRHDKNADMLEVIRRFDKDKCLRPASTPLLGASICEVGYKLWPMIFHSRRCR